VRARTPVQDDPSDLVNASQAHRLQDVRQEGPALARTPEVIDPSSWARAPVRDDPPEPVNERLKLANLRLSTEKTEQCDTICHSLEEL
jgi:hypothetical protein